jgi:hypothetical protein
MAGVDFKREERSTAADGCAMSDVVRVTRVAIYKIDSNQSISIEPAGQGAKSAAASSSAAPIMSPDQHALRQ